MHTVGTMRALLDITVLFFDVSIVCMRELNVSGGQSSCGCGQNDFLKTIAMYVIYQVIKLYIFGGYLARSHPLALPYCYVPEPFYSFFFILPHVNLFSATHGDSQA